MTHIPGSLLHDLRVISGYDEHSFIAAHALPAPVSVRNNPAKDIGVYTGYEPVPWCENGLYLPERPVFTLDPAFHAGAYYVQEASSMFLDHMLRELLQGRSGLRVLDLCAAPGGKSTLMASLLDKESLLVSNEVIRTRASVLEENMTRWGYMNTWVTSNDPRDFSKLTGYFDVIVVDAPCSGSGLWRKDPDALNEWSEANVQLCGQRQQRILADVWPALKEDGILVYATCSYSPQEDEDILDWLAGTYNVSAIHVPLMQEWGIVPALSKQGMAGYRFFPGRVRAEGFFIAAVQKKETADTIRAPKSRPVHDKKIQQQAAHLVDGDDYLCVPVRDEGYSAILPVHETDHQVLSKSVYLRKTGVALGEPSTKEWIPAHDIALSINSNKAIPSLHLDKEQALHFLKREDFGLPSPSRGWYLVRYQGLGLGWVKSLGNRMNNYLPKHWRIRMHITDLE